jgi:hypothetical protein
VLGLENPLAYYIFCDKRKGTRVHVCFLQSVDKPSSIVVLKDVDEVHHDVSWEQPTGQVYVCHMESGVD